MAALCGWLAEEPAAASDTVMPWRAAVCRIRSAAVSAGRLWRSISTPVARSSASCCPTCLDILGMVLVGPKRRQQLGEPPLGHLEDGQGLNEEVGCGLGDVLQLLGALVGLEDIQEDAVMDAGEIEDAELLDNARRPSS